MADIKRTKEQILLTKTLAELTKSMFKIQNDASLYKIKESLYPKKLREANERERQLLNKLRVQALGVRGKVQVIDKDDEERVMIRRHEAERQGIMSLQRFPKGFKPN